MNYNKKSYLGIDMPFFKALHYIVLFTMLHSTFVAPAQGIIEAYANKLGRSKYSGHNVMNENTGNDSSLSESNSNYTTAKQVKTLRPSISESGNAVAAKAVMVLPADIKEGIIGVSKEMPLDNPSDNLFKVMMQAKPQMGDKVYLTYELYGVNDHHAVARSINERMSVGGYMIKRQLGWSQQKEEVDASWIKQGENTILFTVPKGSDIQYRVKNLSLTIEKANTFNSLLVVPERTISLNKDNKIYIKGFIRGNNKEVKVEAGGAFLNVSGGEFEGYITLTEDIKRNKLIMVRAMAAGELLGQEPVMLDNLFEADRAFAIEKKVQGASKLFITGKTDKLEIDGASLKVGDTALAYNYEMSITQLRAIDIAPMESGMVNVTKGGKAYRFLPDGTKFSKPVSIDIAYDTLLIPPGYSARDIKTYYFDTHSKRWTSVQKDTLDTRHKIVTSRTTHFTDYINGIIQTPESPETSASMPTMMNDIKAADPSAEMTLISPPQASQTGEANVSYPIKVPAGRNGMQPNLSLQYSNEGGNSWMGEGWNLSLPAITVDTRWGVPVFDSANETELYSMNGEQLMYPNGYLPHRQQGSEGSYSTTPQSRSSNMTGGAKRFIPRNQGSFAKIERFGTTPSNYYWKVTSTDGTISWYGGTTVAEAAAGAATVKDDSGRIVHWALYKVEDVHGNNMLYSYDIGTVASASSPTLVGSRYIYPYFIQYTGYGTEEYGNYSVEFTRESVTTRPDITVDAKYGFKRATPHRLISINIKYSGQKVRSYHFTYQTSPRFGKTLLTSVSESNESGMEFYKHTFTYYDDVTENGNQMFKAPVTVSVPTANANFALGSFVENTLHPSRINTVQSTQTGFSVNPTGGIEVNLFLSQIPTTTLMIGAPFGENSTKSKGKISLTDINGDGIDDIVYRTSDYLKYKPGQLVFDPAANMYKNTYGDTPIDVKNIRDFSSSKAWTKVMFGESYNMDFTEWFNAGTKRTRSQSETMIYLTDANNDGLVDVVNDGVVQFNYLDENQIPTFTRDSKLTPNMVLTAPSNIAGPPQPTPEEQQDQDEAQPFDDNYDVVRVWQAPASGRIKLQNKIEVITPSSVPLAERPVVNVTIEKKAYSNSSGIMVQGNMCILFGGSIRYGSSIDNILTAPNANCDQSGTGYIWVEKGDRIYFRTHKNSGANPEIKWTIKPAYLDGQFTYETIANASPENYYDDFSSNDFMTTDANRIDIHYTGAYTISWPSFQHTPMDQTTYKVIKYYFDPVTQLGTATTLYTLTCPAGITTTIPAGALAPVTITNQNTSFSFEVSSETNVRTGLQNIWRPVLAYQPDSAAIGQGAIASTTNVIPNYSIFRPADYKGDYRLYKGHFSQQVIGAATYGIKPNKTIVNATFLTSADNGKFILAVRNNTGKVIDKRLVEIVNGTIVVANDAPINICTSCDLNQYTAPNTPANVKVEYYVTEKNIPVFEKYRNAVALKTAVVGFTWPGNGLNLHRTDVVSIFYQDNKHLGTMQKGWGQFLYNDAYDTEPTTPAGSFGSKTINDAIVKGPESMFNNIVNSPLLNTGCDPGLSAEDYQACVEQSLAASLNIPDQNTDINTVSPDILVSQMQGATGSLSFNMPFIPLRPYRPSSNSTLFDLSLMDVYVGFYKSQYIGRDKVRAGGMSDTGPGGDSPSDSSSGGGGLNYNEIADNDAVDNPLPAPTSGTGMIAINKIHRSAERGYTATVAGTISSNQSKAAYSDTVTDYIDLNGDGYPDIITNDEFQKTNMTGGHIQPIQDPMFGSPSSEQSYYRGLGTSGEYSIAGLKSYVGGTSGESEGTSNQDSNTSAGYSINPEAKIGVNVSLDGHNIVEEFWLDVNGDGLPDRVKNDSGVYKYQINKGQTMSNGAFEVYPYLDEYRSVPGAINIDFSVGADVLGGAGSAIGLSGVNISAGASGSSSSTVKSYADVNGDGLVDLLSGDKVRFNTGTGFSSTWTNLNSVNYTHDSTSKSVSFNGDSGLFFGFPICCYIAPILYLKFGLGFGANSSLSINQTEKSLKDLNGDGFVDFVEHEGSNFRVSYSAIGRTNKLKTVANPLGGKFTMDYQASAKSYGNPHARWVMKEVIVEDGYNKVNDGIDTYRKRYEYENGYYDRRERQFYGFETVKQIDYNVDVNGNPTTTVYRTTVSKYHNTSYFLKGLLKESYIMKGSNAATLFSKTENKYIVRKLATDGTINLTDTTIPLTYDTGGKEGRNAAIALLDETTNTIFELGSTGIASTAKMTYNTYGKLTRYSYLGNPNTNADNYTTEIDYHTSTVLTGANLIGIPKEIRVKDNNNAIRRKRTTTLLNEAKGTIGSITALVSGTTTAVTQMQYDQYGNLSKVTLPPNAAGQSMFYEYTYDTAEHKYVSQVKDAFNYISSTTYNYKYDKPLTQTDIAGNTTKYIYDTYGRVTTIMAPGDSPNVNTITMSYFPYVGDTGIQPFQFMPFAITSHNDVQHGANSIQTYTFIDGLARVVQIKKDIELYDIESMSVSGAVSYDAFGRATFQYHPWYESKEPVFNRVFNAYNSPYFSQTDYDEMDRVIHTFDPADNETSISYSIGNDGFSAPALKTRTVTKQTDSSEIITETYKDINGRLTSTKNVLAPFNNQPGADIWTNFTYSSLGELTYYEDAMGGFGVYQYDFGGRKTYFEHSDSNITTYQYDQASNLIKVQTQALADNASIPQQDRFIIYEYDYNRLSEIVFPNTGGLPNVANVLYEYGAAGSGNQTGRLVYQGDATGDQYFEYNALGAMVYNQRRVVGPNIPTRTFDTKFQYDSFNRLLNMTYPDGEVVSYNYDLGGNLKSVKGTVIGQPFSYIKDIDYDYFEQRTRILYGNNTETFYDYSPELRRLNGMEAMASNNQAMFTNKYEYDKVGNVTQLTNEAQPSQINKIGGSYSHNYTYDNLNRLKIATGGFTGDPAVQELGADYESTYAVALAYNNAHCIVQKLQEHYKNGQLVPENSYDHHYYMGEVRIKQICMMTLLPILPLSFSMMAMVI